jgi:signal transduction histidine kinase
MGDETERATILVVDDNEANRLLARDALEGEGYVVLAAASGRDALVQFESGRPDCVLLDVRMPEMDGFAVCERIRALPHGQEIPVVFLTALRDVDTFDRALRAGGDDFLTKPIRPTEMLVRVQTALKLRRVREELREHYELLKHQRDDLLRVQLQKERLMAFLVHDLKNPVHGMDLNAQLLLREPDLSPSVRESAEQIRSGAGKLSRMILNLLDISKADEGKLAPKVARVDLRALVGEVIADLEPSAKERKVTLRASIQAPDVRADEDLLRRTLTNLVENATRHAPRGTAVTIDARTVDAATELRVADAGAGIPPEMRERVFDPFIQVVATQGVERGGRGLGLTFCKLAIEAHGGRIWIEDGTPGAVICMRLPDAG